MFCVHCGSEVPDGAKFCVICGSSIAFDAEGQPTVQPPDQSPAEAPAPVPTVVQEPVAAPTMVQEPTAVPTVVAAGAAAPVAAAKGKPKGKIVAIAIIAAAVAIVAIVLALMLAQGGQEPGASSGPAVTGDEAGTAPAQAAATYSFKTVVLERYASDAGANANVPRFSYVQLSSSEQNSTVDELNALMKHETENALAAKITDEIYEHPDESQKGQMYYELSNYRVSYLEDSAVCVFRDYYTIAPGAMHGMPGLESRIVDLESGKEITAAEFVGKTDADLRIMAWEAADAFLSSNSGLFANAEEAFSDSSASTGIPEDAATFILTPDGVMATFSAYTLVSFAEGTPTLAICDLKGSPIVTGERIEISPLEGEGEVDATSAQQPAEQQPAEQPSGQEQAPADQKAEGKPAQETQEAPAQQPAASAPAVAPVELANQDDYYDLNIFLSNFAEWGAFYRNGKAFDRSSYDLEQLVNWGMWHNAINNDGTLVTESTDLPGAPATSASKEIDGLSPTNYLRHMDTIRIEESISRYMGLDISLSGYDSGDGDYYERDGIMYEGIYRGDAPMVRLVALADSLEDLGDGQVRVGFTIYGAGGSNYHKVVSDKSWYGLNSTSLEQAMRDDGATSIMHYTGTAIVDVNGSGDSRSFTLAYFEANEQ